SVSAAICRYSAIRSALTCATSASSCAVELLTTATSPSGRSPTTPCDFALARSPCASAAKLITSMVSAIEIFFTSVMVSLQVQGPSIRGSGQITLRQAEQVRVTADQGQELLIDLEPLLLGDVHVDVE